jgi:hypothetical protein
MPESARAASRLPGAATRRRTIGRVQRRSRFAATRTRCRVSSSGPANGAGSVPRESHPNRRRHEIWLRCCPSPRLGRTSSAENFAEVSFPHKFPRAVGSALHRRFRALRHSLENRCGRFRPPWVRIPPPPLLSCRAASGCVSDRGTDLRRNRLVLVVPRSTRANVECAEAGCRIRFSEVPPERRGLIHRCRRARAWTSRPYRGVDEGPRARKEAEAVLAPTLETVLKSNYDAVVT